ncbi:hypothetical protein JW711_02695 [Candidatus Woesearchaeota archaeon]|nr:hypothetical protein [Candidatus Woesearchaeota archaeon]
MREFAYDDEEGLLDEIRHEEEPESLRSILNKKKLSRWEMDEAFRGEI